jgi:LmbE family N-acetylglucosaminyl deacetylase
MPHPDDESVFCAGLISRLVYKGHKVKVVTLTKGEKSTLRYGLSFGEDLADARTKEMNKAMKILGVESFRLYDVPDGEIKYKEKNVEEIIKTEVEESKPTYIITLEPSGIYGHPDHIALSDFVTRIVLQNQRSDLVYATVGSKFKASAGARAMAEAEIVPLEPNMYIKLSPKEILKKISALMAHRSQFRNKLLPRIFKWFRKEIVTKEFYVIVE